MSPRAAAAKRRESPREGNKERIIEAALALFAEFGYHGTSIPQVMERAGVGAGTVYRLFDSKEALVNAVFRDAKRRLEVALRHGLEPSGAHSRPLELRGAHSRPLELRGAHSRPLELRGAHSRPLELRGPHSRPLEPRGPHSRPLDTSLAPRALFDAFWARLAAFAKKEPIAFRFLELQDHVPYLDGESRGVEIGILAPILLACMDLQRRGVFRAEVPPDATIALIWGAFVGLVKAERLGYLKLDDKTTTAARDACWRAFATNKKK